MTWRPARRLLPNSMAYRLLFLVFIVLAPVLLLESYLDYSRREERRADELRTNLELARAVETTFNAFVDDVLHQAKAIGTAFEVPGAESLEQRNRLLAVGSEYPSLRELSWVDREGRIVASSNPAIIGVDASNRAYFRDLVAGQDWVVSDLLQALVGGEPVFAIGRAIRDDAGACAASCSRRCCPSDWAGCCTSSEPATRASISSIAKGG